MTIILIRHTDAPQNLFTETASIPSADGLAPLQTQTLPFIQTQTASEGGIWECSPGRFQRQVRQAELMHIIEGEGSFTPSTAGEPVVRFQAGDTLFFPANTLGLWCIEKTLRKVYAML